MKKYVQAFEQKCTLSSIYSNSDLGIILKNQNLPLFNITAFTYNRWNKGMTSLNPLFVWDDGGKYKYIGNASKSTYTGKVYHYPQGDDQVYLIAHWKNGIVTFLNDINNFAEWKETDFNGLKIVSIGSKVIVDYKGENRKWSFEVESTGYQKIKKESTLGKSVYGKKEGDMFQLGDYKGKIIQIN